MDPDTGSMDPGLDPVPAPGPAFSSVAFKKQTKNIFFLKIFAYNLL